MDEGDLAGGSRREIVGKDRHAPPEHDDAAALVVRRDQEAASESVFQTREQPREPFRRLEVAAIEHEAAGPRGLEEADVGVRHVRPWQAEHQLAADHLLEGHQAQK